MAIAISCLVFSKVTPENGIACKELLLYARRKPP